MINLRWMKPYKKQIQETIEEIHNSFEIASDLALKEAKEILNKPMMSNEAKVQKMIKLGFNSAKGVEKYNEEKKLKSLKQDEANTIAIWAMRYPQYKFILDRQVADICKKYNLVCGESHLYKGDIPMKNLLEIEAFKLRPEHTTVSRTEVDYNRESGSFLKIKLSTEKPLDRNDFSSFDEYINRLKEVGFYTEVKFQICAPISDMNTEGMKLEGHKLVREIPDPIVLYPVPNGYLVVSKWGLEGDDEALINEKMN